MLGRPSQFSREYSRFFGRPPRADTCDAQAGGGRLHGSQASKDLEPFFPWECLTDAALDAGAERVAELRSELTALAWVSEAERGRELRLVRIRAGRAHIDVLDPVLDDLELTARVERLWRGQTEELGGEVYDSLAVPSAERPLCSGHPKARLAAISERALLRRPDDVAALLEALLAPENAGKAHAEVRRALYRAVSWFDLPEVRSAVLQDLRNEDPRTRQTLEYVSWRLEGLHTRPA